jgi:cobalt/nickel transport system ATP-binding protein
MMVDITHLYYTYPDGTPALTDINIKIEDNCNVALIGSNGSGKTTLLLNMLGILRGEGDIRVLGETNCNKIREKVGMVFQNPDDQLFMPTVFDDVAFGPLNFELDDVEDRVHKALHRVGLAGFEQRSSSHLSFGEKKRVALATVLSMEPKLLILDEPTSSLDPGGRRELMKMLEELPLPKIIATHDLELAARICDHTLFFHKGWVVMEGNSHEILSDTKTLRTYGL